MDWHYLVDTLDLDDCFPITNDIHPIAAIQLDTLVFQWQRFLPFHEDFSQL